MGKKGVVSLLLGVVFIVMTSIIMCSQSTEAKQKEVYVMEVVVSGVPF